MTINKGNQMKQQLLVLKTQKTKAQKALAWKIECKYRLTKAKKLKPINNINCIAKNKYDIERFQKAYDKAKTKVTEYKGLNAQITKLEKEINKLNKKTTKPTKLTQKSKELKSQIKETEVALQKAELAEKQLEAKKREIKAQRELVKLENEALELTRQEVVIVEQINETLKIKIDLIRQNEALTEKYNKIQALIRQEQNLARVFTAQQKRELFLQSGGKCKLCLKEVALTEFEADHIIPFSKGGETTLENGQCLCRSCNRRKGAL